MAPLKYIQQMMLKARQTAISNQIIQMYGLLSFRQPCLS